MEFRILGPIEVLDGRGAPLELGRRKQRCLLAILLLNANQAVPVDRLVDLLWADEAPDQAAGAIQGYISNLRRVLEPRRAPRTASRVIITQAPGYLVRVEDSQLDVTRFSSLLAEGESVLADGHPDAARRCLVEALDLWRGPALADFADESFAVAEAGRLAGLRLVAVEGRIEADIILGNHAVCVPELERLTEQNPLRERLWRLLMLALYRADRQAEALQAFQAARAKLIEHGLEPGPALRALEADIIGHAPSVQRSRPASQAVAAPAGGFASGPRRGHGAFVGRQTELDQLTDAMADVGAGRGRLILISGEAGIGKTRLARELVDRATAAGALVAWGRGHEGRGAPAFWPWIQVVRSLDDSLDADELRSALGTGGAELAQVVPDLRDVLGEVSVPDSIDPEALRFRFYEALTSLIVRVAERRPLVVVLDDVQWTDAPTLRLIEFLAAGIRDHAVLVLATYRPNEVDGAHPLARTLAELARWDSTDSVPLSGLSVDDVTRLLASELDHDPDLDLSKAVHSRTEGNPFFVIELVRLMTGIPGAGTDTVDLRRDVPTRVRDVLRDRLSRLADGTNALLELAAVAGRDFDLRLLELGSGLPPDDVLLLLDGALASGLVTESPGADGDYRFSHALVQDALYGGLSSLRRSRLHGRVARAMEALYGADDDRASELAHHAFEAAAVNGAESAIAHVVRAAAVAQSRLAFEQAQHHLLRALELVARLPSGTERDAAELGIQLSIASWTSMTEGWTAGSIGNAWERAAELCRAVGALDELLATLWGLWVFSIMKGDPATSIEMAARLVELGRETGDPALVASGAATTAYNRLHRGDFEGAVTQIDGALELTATLDPAWLRATLNIDLPMLMLATSSWVALITGDGKEAIRRRDEVVARATVVEHPFSSAAALAIAATLDAFRGDTAGARATSEQALAVTTEHGIRHYHAYAQVLHGWAVAARGEPTAGLAELEAGLDDMDATGWVLQRPVFESLRADALVRSGRPEDAVNAVDRGLATADACDERFWEAELCRQRAELVAILRPEARDEVVGWLRRAGQTAQRQGALPLLERIRGSEQRLRRTR